MFEEEAWANNVYPLYDDMIQRMANINNVLFGDQKEFVVLRAGRGAHRRERRRPRSRTARTRSRRPSTFRATSRVSFSACGGMTGGYTMFIKGGRAALRLQLPRRCALPSLTSPRLPKGKTDLKFNFTKTKEFGGTGELYVNGKRVDQAEFPQMHISTYSLAETFDVGRDTGTQVDPSYEGGPFPFDGELDRVVITLRD